MSISSFLDQVPLLAVLAAFIIVLVFFIETGFRLGIAHSPNSVKAQLAQVRGVMGATLGLLAFMLAFTFSTAQMHYETRVQNMVEEARIAGTAYLHADFLGQDPGKQAKEILYQYVQDRLEIQKLAKQNRVPEAMTLIIQAEAMHHELWQIAVGAVPADSATAESNVQNEPFKFAVIELINIHNQRLQAALMNRISPVVWLIIFLTAILSMLVMGYQAGLTGKRTPIATFSLAIAFSAVMILITDLDRPRMSLFEINNQTMINLQEKMSEGLKQPGNG